MQFIAGTLQQTWNNAGLRDLMDLTMIPYGNAKQVSLLETGENSSAAYQCQHGQNECLYNMMEGCAIKKLTQAQYMPYIFCSNGMLQANGQLAVADIVAKCAPDPVSKAAISGCYGNGQGAEAFSILGEMSQATAALGHQYIPWIVVNGNGAQSILSTTNLPAVLCQAHVAAGGAKPVACPAALFDTQDVPDRIPTPCMKGLSAEEDEVFRSYLGSINNKTYEFPGVANELDLWQKSGKPHQHPSASSSLVDDSELDEDSLPTSKRDSAVREHHLANAALVRRENLLEADGSM